ncbi:type VII secretion target [Amycolatopsis anabasis]|uniref:type VII secretion target n=1 Tax=Amycolatopsis anabasis TaxID=1840409 RepID=UPI00131B50F1|nr:type VII secretion target [Amycolatopsis anabasis]
MPDGGGGKGYEVLHDELGTHAGKVDGLAQRLQTAVDAAQQVTMDNSAYGVICQPFALMLDPFEKMGVDALRKAHEAVTDSAGKVRDAAKQYEGKEKDTIQTLKSTGGAEI